MMLLAWDQGLETGHAVIDAQHRSLVDALNALARSLAPGGDPEGVERSLLGLVRITESHFADEESFMAAADYPHLASHHVLHEELLAQARELLARVRQDRTVLTVAALDFLKVWLVKHIKEQDLPLAGCLARLQAP